MTSGYGWGAASLANLGTCDPLLILLFQRAIKRADLKRDMRVVYGHRTNAQQADLYAKGRTFEEALNEASAILSGLAGGARATGMPP
jgi:hypothetical protein